MKLSERLLNGEFQGAHLILTDLYCYSPYVKLSDEIKKLEDENADCKARLQGISQRAEDLQAAALEMEDILHKFRTGG